MRVGVDATSWINRRGYGRFARNAVGRLVELDTETTYVMYIDEQSAGEAELPARAQQRCVRLGRPPSEAAAADSSRSPADILRLTLAVRRDALDVFLFPSVYTYFPVLSVPTVVGVHDAIARRLPELTLPSRRARAFWRAKENLALRRASRVFTVSEASRAALVEQFGLEPQRLAIVPEAPDPVFAPRGAQAVAVELGPLGLSASQGFLLFAGGVSPHKNVETLLDAYASLLQARPQAPPLVVAGDLERDPYLSSSAAVRERIARLELGSHVVLPGFVSDEALACLYSAATAVVLPSLAEGFGLPAVEAAACGAPTVLSDLPAHRETLGDAALFFPARDAPHLAEQLARVLDDPALRSRLSERGRKAVASFSWDAAADRLREILAEAGGRPMGRRRADSGEAYERTRESAV